MHRRILALVLLLALLGPLAAGARQADLDPNGVTATSADGPTVGAERAADLDPNGLQSRAPAPFAWLGSLVRALFEHFGL